MITCFHIIIVYKCFFSSSVVSKRVRCLAKRSESFIYHMVNSRPPPPPPPGFLTRSIVESEISTKRDVDLKNTLWSHSEKQLSILCISRCLVFDKIPLAPLSYRVVGELNLRVILPLSRSMNHERKSLKVRAKFNVSLGVGGGNLRVNSHNTSCGPGAKL